MDVTRLLDLPIWLSSLIVVGVPILWVSGGIGLTRRRFSHAALQLNNEVAGFIYAAVGVVYAVVLAFVFIVVWEGFSNTEGVVENEASALASIYRQVQTVFPEAPAQQVRNHIYAYSKLVIEDEWPEMQRGNAVGSEKARAEYNAIWDSVRAIKPTNVFESSWYSEILQQLNTVASNRRIRLTRSNPDASPLLWLLLLLGAVLTIGYTFLFGVRHLVAQMIMCGILTALTALILFVIFQMQHPFRGTFRIHPIGFEREVVSFERQMRAQNIPFPVVGH